MLLSEPREHVSPTRRWHTDGRTYAVHEDIDMKVVNLQPREVEYKGHTIRLTHRPKINDWTYEVIHTRTVRLSNHAPRYGAALDHAKAMIDNLVSDGT